MRFVLPLAALALFAAPAFAQTVSPTTTPMPATQPGVAPSVSGAKAAPAAEPAPHRRLTMDERFAKANTTHDGRLTLAQAKAGYPTIVRHFTQIDAAKKGYITVGEIHAWEKAEREQHRAREQAAASPTKG